ncbi:MAG TPA: hypothetical protein VH307_13435 [Streptosporangiaceae bacterium]|nr:hypothetical protein [Streptosporangiaceae bacterium]
MTRDLQDVDFADLAAKVGNRLLHVQAPLRACVTDPGSPAAGAALAFIQGGGFGSLSRRYGTAAGNMLEARWCWRPARS